MIDIIDRLKHLGRATEVLPDQPSRAEIERLRHALNDMMHAYIDLWDETKMTSTEGNPHVEQAIDALRLHDLNYKAKMEKSKQERIKAKMLKTRGNTHKGKFNE